MKKLAIVAILLSGCAISLKDSISESFYAAQSISVGGEEIIKSVCIDIAHSCQAEGKRQDQCGGFQACARAHAAFLNAAKSAITALSLADAARTAGDEKEAHRLLEAAHIALGVARDIVSQFLGVDEPAPIAEEAPPNA